MENENVIHEYLQGSLNEDEKKKFEHRLESDQAFFQEYHLQKHMYAYLLERKSRDTYTAELERLGDKYFLNEELPKKSSVTRNIILSIITLAILLAAWYVLKPKQVTLYESNAQHFALHLVLKSDENTVAINAENSFNSGDFNEATVAIQKYLENNSIDTKAKLALGISYLETGKAEEAARIFDEIGNGNSTLKDYAIWYKALYFVKQSELKKAYQVLESIPDRDPQLYNKAQVLLKDIDALVVK